MIRGLENIADEAARIRAIGRNHDLWAALIKDLALSSNALPETLKRELIALGQWSMQYSTLAILQKLPVQPMINVNRNIAEGLTTQRARSAQDAARAIPPNGIHIASA